MKRILLLFTLLISLAVYAQADSPGVTVKPGKFQIDKGKFLYADHVHAVLHGSTSNGGYFYNMTTSDVWYDVDTYSESTFHTLSGVQANGTITITEGEGGHYFNEFHAQIKANSGAVITLRMAVNGVTQKIITRPMASGPTREVSFVNFSAGSTLSNITTMSFADGVYYTIDESASDDPAILATFRFDNVDMPKCIDFGNTLYTGAGIHDVRVQALNAAFGRYTDMTINDKDFPDVADAPENELTRQFGFPTPQGDYVDSNNQAFVRLHHTGGNNSGHDIRIDALHLKDGSSGASISASSHEALVPGDQLKLQIKSDTANTTLDMFGVGLYLERVFYIE